MHSFILMGVSFYCTKDLTYSNLIQIDFGFLFLSIYILPTGHFHFIYPLNQFCFQIIIGLHLIDINLTVVFLFISNKDDRCYLLDEQTCSYITWIMFPLIKGKFLCLLEMSVYTAFWKFHSLQYLG